LETAFYYGHVEIVRMLLAANADLEYVNSLLWACPRYMYDPERSSPDTIELLEICAAEGFDLWDAQDAVGWTIAHRAAAFGRGRDVKKLWHLGTSFHTLVHNLNWLPIHCALRYRNESTFDFLASLIHPSSFATLTDSRGWTLLHVAAEGGSEVLMAELLRRGLSPLEKSDATTRWVPEDLKLRELLPMDIATKYGNRPQYERALKATGYSDSVRDA
jgi:ankyrin repeat protein